MTNFKLQTFEFQVLIPHNHKEKQAKDKKNTINNNIAN
jgi:hypothetical protein